MTKREAMQIVTDLLVARETNSKTCLNLAYSSQAITPTELEWEAIAKLVGVKL